MRFAVVTNCTNRKRGDAMVLARNVAARETGAFVQEWRVQLESTPNKNRLAELYIGRGFSLARDAAKAAEKLGGADLLIVSAGLGLCRADDQAASYGLTIAPGHADSVTDLLGVSPSEWWADLTFDKHKFLRAIPPQAIAIVSLSTRYFEMVEKDLDAFAQKRPGMLRLIIRCGDRLSSEALEDARLPYDARLNGPQSSMPGTEADFCSRALHHFVHEVLQDAPDGDVRGHRKAVETALSTWKRPSPIRRQNMSNDQIVAILRDLDPSVGSGRALRILRDEKQIACEQGRFKELFRKARETSGLFSRR